MAKGDVIRDPAFADRFSKACDGNEHVPDLHQGRLSWVAEQTSKKLGKPVPLETVRKWSKGISKPREATSNILAEILLVDPTWLYIGTDTNDTPRERRLRNSAVDGVVNVVAGLIQMDGNSVAFPEEDDITAQRDRVDMFAIIKGAQYRIHVALGEKTKGGYRFALPPGADRVTVLGVVRDGMSLLIAPLTAEHEGQTKQVVIVAEEAFTGSAISSFSKRF